MNTKPILFLAFANDRDDRARYLRNLAEEARQVQRILAAAEGRGHCELVLRQNATAGDILDVFQDPRYRDRIALFHFGGHTDGYWLLLETAAGKPAAADAGGLARFLAQQRGLQLVFLNGCSTEGQVSDLLDAGVQAVIATDQAVEDALATAFAARFYQGLVGGAAIGTAFEQAKAALQMQGGAVFRHIGAAEEDGGGGRIPWRLHYRDGAEAVAGWSLPQAVADPLFGLPDLPPLDLPPGPFRHLSWFGREHAEVFFGRGQQIRDLYQHVTDPRGAPIVLLSGQAGVGKSSLLAAGLLPRLESSHDVYYGRRDQALGLRGTLQQMLGAAGEGSAGAWRRLETASGRPLVVILDQVEETYTRPHGEPQQELAELLAALQPLFLDFKQRPQGRLLLGFRKEWSNEVRQALVQQRLAYSEVFLERLDRQGIVEAVQGPARSERLRRHFGLTVAADLPDTIAGDLLEDAGSAVAPTLQILLTKMWERARTQDFAHPAFDLTLYQALKRDGLLLADFLDQQLRTLIDVQPSAAASGLALDLLAFHTTSLGTAEQRTQAALQQEYQHQAAALPALVHEMQARYLLVDPAQNQPDQPPSTRLAHDTLAPLVRERFDRSDAPGPRARRILELRMRDAGHAPDALLSVADLNALRRGLGGTRALSPAENVLLQRSQRHQTQMRFRQLALLAGLLLILGVAWIIPLVSHELTRRDVIEAHPTVTVGNLLIDRYEVSVGRYKQCVAVGACKPLESPPPNYADEQRQKDPIRNINALSARDFCAWIGRRLPSSDEWQYAARLVYQNQLDAAGAIIDPQGMNQDSEDVWAADHGAADDASATQPLHLIGNVWEWTCSPGTGNNTDQCWRSGDPLRTLIVRGGGYDSSIQHLNEKQTWTATRGSRQIGFRCVAQPAQSATHISQ